jgi:GTPase
MTDLVKLLFTAGDGGHGRVSFRREKYVAKGGPDGGKGGDGGDVVIRASREVSTLDFFAGKNEFKAQSGEPGGRRKKSGAAGQPMVLEVPLGTKIWVVAENEVAGRRRRLHDIHHRLKKDEVRRKTFTLEKEGQAPPPLEAQAWVLPRRTWPDTAEAGESGATSGAASRTLGEGLDVDELSQQSAQELLRNFPNKIELITLSEDGQEIILAQGGFGGFGNENYKGPERTTPLIAQYGTEGEKRLVLFEHKLLADIGLAGFPNAGKSTLLSVLTKARPKIASYPFTTLEPHLGVMSTGWAADRGRTEVVIADIPGLIEGASQGKGLGHEFLRHVENTAAILFVLALDESLVFDEGNSDLEKAQLLAQQLDQLKIELRSYNPELLAKQQLVGINKIDIYPESLRLAISDLFQSVSSQNGGEPLLFSAATGEGLPELKEALVRLVSTAK